MIKFPEKYCDNPKQYNDFKAKVLELVDEKIQSLDSMLKSTPEPNREATAYYQYLSDRVANLEAWAQYEMGCKYHDVNDVMVKYSPEMAVVFYQLAAEQNYLEAQYKLAQCLQTGDGIDYDFEASMKWLCSAASQGHLSAQYEYGVNLIRINPLNLAQGIGWIQRAAENGLPEAQFSLGIFYESDMGIHLLGDTAQDEATKWFWSAAEQGDMHAQFKIGNYYEFGLGGLEQNLSEAINWYIASANQGNETAKHHVNTLLDIV